jgi:hypothetical protein
MKKGRRVRAAFSLALRSLLQGNDSEHEQDTKHDGAEHDATHEFKEVHFHSPLRSLFT